MTFPFSFHFHSFFSFPKEKIHNGIYGLLTSGQVEIWTSIFRRRFFNAFPTPNKNHLNIDVESTAKMPAGWVYVINFWVDIKGRQSTYKLSCRHTKGSLRFRCLLQWLSCTRDWGVSGPGFKISTNIMTFFILPLSFILLSFFSFSQKNTKRVSGNIKATSQRKINTVTRKEGECRWWQI